MVAVGLGWVGEDDGDVPGEEADGEDGDGDAADDADAEGDACDGDAEVPAVGAAGPVAGAVFRSWRRASRSRPRAGGRTR